MVSRTCNIFRYKFSEPVFSLIEQFASVHKFDEPFQFKEAWDEWYKEHRCDIDREKGRLTSLGYTGNIADKMYKSARYYFKNKSSEKKKVKKRSKYVTLDKKFLADMDKHIQAEAFKQNMKPAYAYNNFISDSKYSIGMDAEVNRLTDEEDWKGPAIETKMKKTYKNRYFMQQNKSSK